MTEIEQDKFLANFSSKFKEAVRKSNKTLSDLAIDADITEAGLHKMLSTGSMKIKTLKKLSEVLDIPITMFFEGDIIHQKIKGNHNNQQVGTNSFTDQPANYGNELEFLRETVGLLKNQLKDKEEIIEFLKAKK